MTTYRVRCRGQNRRSGCEPERVTGFVDDELPAAEAAAVAAHLETCPTCRAQAEGERALRARLAGLAAPDLPEGLGVRVREASRARQRLTVTLARWALPVAAVLVLGGWLRGHAPFVAWDLARDHDKCFSRQPLPALPAEVGELRLVGARYCPLVSLASAPHVYYASATRQLSVFLVPHDLQALETALRPLIAAR